MSNLHTERLFADDPAASNVQYHDRETMRALTLWQPWATLIECGAKRIETRSWHTNYRGDIAIHAAASIKPDEKLLCLTEPFYSCLLPTGYIYAPVPPERNTTDNVKLPFGVIVAVAKLVDCRYTGAHSRIEGAGIQPWVHHLTEQERAFGDYSPGRYGWILEDIRPLPVHVTARGFQMLWSLQQHTHDRVQDLLRQLGEQKEPNSNATPG